MQSHTTFGSKQTPGMIHLAIDTFFRSLKNHFASFEELEELCDLKRHRTSTAVEAGLVLDWKQSKLDQNAFHQSSLCHETVDIDIKKKYGIYISIAEIYKGKVYDLFEEGEYNSHTRDLRTPLNVKIDSITHEASITGARKMFVSNCQEAFRTIEKGMKARACDSTDANQTSSRSHAIITIEIKSIKTRSNHAKQSDSEIFEDEYSRVMSSKFTIADLAGNERNEKTDAKSARLQESKSINASWMNFGHCLALQRGGEKKHITDNSAFRSDNLSKLLLLNAFRPYSPQKSVMLVTIDPYGDARLTAQILRYTSTVRDVPNTTPKKLLPPPPPSSAPRFSHNTSNAGGYTSPMKLRAPSPSKTNKLQSSTNSLKSKPSRDIFTTSLHNNDENRRPLRSQLSLEQNLKNFQKSDKSESSDCTEHLKKIAELEDTIASMQRKFETMEKDVRKKVCDSWEKRLEKIVASYKSQLSYEEKLSRDMSDEYNDLQMRKIGLLKRNHGEINSTEKKWKRRCLELEKNNERLAEENQALKHLLAEKDINEFNSSAVEYF